MENDFKVSKFYAYNGPNYYLDRQALVFNLYLDPKGYRVDLYEKKVIEKFPQLEGKIPEKVVDLFAEVLIQVLKMDIDLYINKYSISLDKNEYVIAVEYLDEYITEDAVYFVCDWFRAMTEDKMFDFDNEFEVLQQEFDKTVFGGPTIYSLIEAGLKRNIPVHFLEEENQFQWGYGKKQIRGRSTTFQVDGIKDTEFTMYKDMVADFLEMCGFPTPKGKNCFSAEEIVEEAEKLGFPCVVKPVAGHKGQGVTTGIESVSEVIKAYNNIITASETEGVQFEGALVQQQIYGTDHRLLSIGGKFSAALERVPAYVEGNGKNTIEELIQTENNKVVRLDNARSPLCKIKIDDDLKDYLVLQDISLSSIPAEGKKIYLRRVANISQGGVSINVTDKIHPKNIKLVEDIAKFFDVTCLGIDVLAKDISKPWCEGDFGIIEVNAGPGVFMHLAPAIGGSIDVPGIIMKKFFPKEGFERIPIIAGNNLSLDFCKMLYEKLNEMKWGIEFSSLTEEGIHFNGEYFFKNKDHYQNVKLILRKPQLDFAIFNHNQDDILDQGTYHEGADIVVLENPKYAEATLKRQILPGGFLFEIDEENVIVYQDDEEKAKYPIENPANKDKVLLMAIEQKLDTLIDKYE